MFFSTNHVEAPFVELILVYVWFVFICADLKNVVFIIGTGNSMRLVG